MSRKQIPIAVLVLSTWCWCVGIAAAGPEAASKWVTLSGRGVIMSGQQQTEIRLPVPICASGKEFLVTGLQAAPEVSIGATSMDVMNLKTWAVSVPVYQRVTNGSIQVPLTVIGQGPEHLSAALAAGQSLYGYGPPIVVTVSLLGGSPATHRFEFNVHVTGACGMASTMRS